MELNQSSGCLDCVHPIDESGQCLIAKMFEKPATPEHGCSWRVPLKRKDALTNGDKIRAMSNDELVELLIGSYPCDCQHGCPNDCENCIREWLESEVQNE